MLYDTSRPPQPGDLTTGILKIIGFIVAFCLIVKNCGG